MQVQWVRYLPSRWSSFGGGTAKAQILRRSSVGRRRKGWNSWDDCCGGEGLKSGED